VIDKFGVLLDGNEMTSVMQLFQEAKRCVPAAEKKSASWWRLSAITSVIAR